MRRTTSNLLLHWIPYILIAVGLGAGLYVVNEGVQRDQDERNARIRTDCVLIQSNYDTLVALIGGPPNPLPVPDNPDLAEIVQTANARSQANYLHSLETLGPRPVCNGG